MELHGSRMQRLPVKLGDDDAKSVLGEENILNW
jgi:hypothetical protein